VFLENFQKSLGGLSKLPSDTCEIMTNFGFYEELLGGMNWSPGDTTLLIQFLGFHMNGLIVMNTRQVT